MNAVEIEEQVSLLAEAPFDAAEFPFAFLEAFGEKETTIKRLQSTGKTSTNKSDLDGVLQRSNIHIKVCAPGRVGDTLKALVASPATAKQKAKFALATDGEEIQAENLVEGETLACAYTQLGDRFAFFLALAGISTVKAIRENAFDIKATGRLNKLYVTLLKDNPDWATDERREDLNHFFARLIFCFFAEDTNIFANSVFTEQFERMSGADDGNAHEVLAEFFRAMATPHKARDAADIKNWAKPFPYVNGGLFAGDSEVPRFTKVARAYLIHIGHLDWRSVNPDIFGSMIQAVADDEERSSLGMHYTSVPNILKVLNPLFLDDLRQNLADAADSPRKLLNLRKRLAHIRVFDPACGSGNFLVIAYKQMRAIEAEINQRRGEPNLETVIPIDNFRGIEIRHFAAEIARLALVIAKFQSDVLHRGETLAVSEFLPLHMDNWIVCGNALRLDWATVCPPFGKTGRSTPTELFEEVQETVVEFQNEGGEVYVCGNPPYKGSKWQTLEQKKDMKIAFRGIGVNHKSLDYVAGWFSKAVKLGKELPLRAAFVSTNSINQGLQVPMLWPDIYSHGFVIDFAYTSFLWKNLAQHNAAVKVVIVCISNLLDRARELFDLDANGIFQSKQVDNINSYLISGQNINLTQARRPLSELSYMDLGNMPKDGGNLILSYTESRNFESVNPSATNYIKNFMGSQEFTKGIVRRCIWIEEGEQDLAVQIPEIAVRVSGVKAMRLASSAKSTRDYHKYPFRFKQIQGKADNWLIVVPKVTSENREYLPVGIESNYTIVSDAAYAIYDSPIWNLAVILSRLHLSWIATTSGKLKTDYRYSNTLGWNTFPVPPLTTQNKADLTTCAEEILLARERYFPATIADIYDPKRMDREFPDVRRAHERNDEVLERIYIGRRFKNDTERLEVLFRMYEEMVG